MHPATLFFCIDDASADDKLHDILVITVCAVICGLDHWTEIEDFGKANESWFNAFLDLPNGIPSHDTFGKVLAPLEPDAFERRIQQWIHAMVGSDTKGNQSSLQEDVQIFMDDLIARQDVGHCDYYETLEKSHGRIETRKCWTCCDVDWLVRRHCWAGLSSVVAVECTRSINGKTSTERRYFISSHSGRQAQKLAVLIRNHWRVENELHWTLDVCFNEDQSRVRVENAAENLARIRRISLLLLKNEKTCKLGVKSKRAKAGYDRNYLLTLLGFRVRKDTNSP